MKEKPISENNKKGRLFHTHHELLLPDQSKIYGEIYMRVKEPKEKQSTRVSKLVSKDKGSKSRHLLHQI